MIRAIVAVLVLAGPLSVRVGDAMADEVRGIERTFERAAALIRALEAGIEPKKFEAHRNRVLLRLDRAAAGTTDPAALERLSRIRADLVASCQYFGCSILDGAYPDGTPIRESGCSCL